MILENATPKELAGFGAEVCVIGGGPVGLCLALALEARGRRVLVLESGGSASDPMVQALSEGELADSATHHAPEHTTARRLGGAGNLWGGRCLPFDPIDFAERPWFDGPRWPIGKAALDPWLEAACAALGAGAPAFSAPAPGGLGAADADFALDRLERWSDEPRTHRLHAVRLRESERLAVALRTTVAGFRWETEGDRERLAALELRPEGGPAATLPVREVVLAAGGNESARLLLADRDGGAPRAAARYGGQDGPLGRFYMGHVAGRLADIAFADPETAAAFDFHVDAHGSYVRRRFVPSDSAQAAHRLPNVAFWPVTPDVAQPEHRSGPLSLVFLALSLPALGRRIVAEPIRLRHAGEPPYRRGAHLLNILRDPVRVAGFAPWWIWNRKFASHRVPGFFLRNAAGRYGLEYHAEQRAQAGSRLTLAAERDRLGLPRLRIDYRFCDADAEGVVRAHDALEGWLERTGIGRLDYRVSREVRAAAVLAEAKHGNHQVGTIRMAAKPGEGVVDPDLRVFGTANLHVASTAVLPTSGQANPTLTAVQLALRLADRLAGGAAEAD